MELPLEEIEEVEFTEEVVPEDVPVEDAVLLKAFAWEVAEERDWF